MDPRWAQDGPKSGQEGQDGQRSELDGRKMAHDMEDELQDAAQDRQDAISKGCIEEFAKKNPVKGPSRGRPGVMRGPALDFV